MLFRIQLEKSPSSAAIDRRELIYPFPLESLHQSDIDLDQLSGNRALRFPYIGSRHPSFGSHQFLAFQNFVNAASAHDDPFFLQPHADLLGAEMMSCAYHSDPLDNIRFGCLRMRVMRP